jgi:hypothetical protein
VKWKDNHGTERREQKKKKSISDAITSEVAMISIIVRN